MEGITGHQATMCEVVDNDKYMVKWNNGKKSIVHKCDIILEMKRRSQKQPEWYFPPLSDPTRPIAKQTGLHEIKVDAWMEFHIEYGEAASNIPIQESEPHKLTANLKRKWYCESLKDNTAKKSMVNTSKPVTLVITKGLSKVTRTDIGVDADGLLKKVVHNTDEHEGITCSDANTEPTDKRDGLGNDSHGLLMNNAQYMQPNRYKEMPNSIKGRYGVFVRSRYIAASIMPRIFGSLDNTLNHLREAT
jgi:hypothetical protein